MLDYLFVSSVKRKRKKSWMNSCIRSFEVKSMCILQYTGFTLMAAVTFPHMDKALSSLLWGVWNSIRKQLPGTPSTIVSVPGEHPPMHGENIQSHPKLLFKPAEASTTELHCMEKQDLCNDLSCQ